MTGDPAPLLPFRDQALDELRDMNANLAELGGRPLITVASARAFDDDQLRTAIYLTADHLVHLGKTILEAGG